MSMRHGGPEVPAQKCDARELVVCVEQIRIERSDFVKKRRSAPDVVIAHVLSVEMPVTMLVRTLGIRVKCERDIFIEIRACVRYPRHEKVAEDDNGDAE